MRFNYLIGLSFCSVAEARPVIISYSEIYDLGFDESKIDDSLTQVRLNEII